MPIDAVQHSDPGRLSEFLNLSGARGTWAGDELASVLRHQLSASLEWGAPPSGNDPAPAATPRTFGGLLAEPNPPVEDLVRLKAFAKPFVSGADPSLPREIGAALYYAAIIAARVRCGARISELDDASLRHGMSEIVRGPWLDESLRSLLEDGLRELTPPAEA